MKSFRILCIVIISIAVLSFAFVNVSLISSQNSDNGRPYRVEASRIEQDILNDRDYKLDDYEYITDVEILDDSNKNSFYSGDSDYFVKVIDGELYRFDYSYTPSNENTIMNVNIALSLIFLSVAILLIFLYINIIRPFAKLKNMPTELAKGNLTSPLKENKYAYFGKFVWGMDLLREKLEQQKTNELALQKDKKTLVLSLSHDIKTPLGIIELYAKALKKGLYTDEEKKAEIAQNISEKCTEIKSYVDDIIKASNEDFLNLEVQSGEFYLSELVESTRSFYTDKLNLLKTEFVIDKYSDVVLKGDIDRAVEVVQNIIENAVKYGDGENIKISFAREEEALLLSIENSGSQLSENELTHIFDSFWRGSNTGSNSGSGLGLYICRQLMYKMGGDIFAENKNNIMKISLVFSLA